MIEGILRNFEENHFRLHESQALVTNVLVATHIHEKEPGSLDLNGRMFNFIGREHLPTSAGRAMPEPNRAKRRPRSRE